MIPGRLVIISGLSGSGKSTAARALEDEGFFVVDNLPVVLLPQFLKTFEGSAVETDEVAVVLDVRNREFLSECDKILDEVEAFGVEPEILFLDADEIDILKRFSETRRRHPLALDMGVSDGVRLERELLARLRNRATVTIDSSQLTPHQLRARVVGVIAGLEDKSRLTVRVQSFGFRYGLPPESDIVIDVRFLPNPHFDPGLQALTGRDGKVSRYVLEKKECRELMVQLQQLFGFLIPRYRDEGKNYLTISLGCTGGKHRSVAVAEELARTLPAQGLYVKVEHRDVDNEEYVK
ncbi:MAG: RNase adapter RapZ [Desulfuromonas sp.]|nr:MAG: RNase adapter RapZ [Desulfuromonas sp.]